MPEIDLEGLENFLNERIKGQEFAMKAMASAAIRAELGLSKKGRPKSVFLLLGPTGTGKTESTLNLGSMGMKIRSSDLSAKTSKTPDC